MPTTMQLPLVAAFVVAALTLTAVPVAEAYNILGIFPSMSRSHHITGSALMRGLAEAGHNVTVISPFPLAKPVPNYRDIAVQGIVELMNVHIPDILAMSDRNPLLIQRDININGHVISNFTLTHPAVRRFLADPSERFDVIVLEAFINEAMLGFGHHFGAPVIGYSTFGASMWTNEMVGSPSPLSYVPHPFLGYTDRMSFGQRLFNTLMTVHEAYQFIWHLQSQQDMYDRLFPGAAKPPLAQLRRNVSLVLLNTHHSLGSPRPYMPNMIEIGGVHIDRRPKAVAGRTLPDALRQFIEGAGQPGIIYFSLGTNIRSADVPADVQAGILRALGSLSQRVLWKWENADLVNRPANVLVSPWFPQADVLGHPAVRLFISHGGLLSTTEAVYHGVPMVGIPVFGDQALNMGRAEVAGFARTLHYRNVTEESLRWAIEEVLGSDGRYARAAKLAQQRYRDQPMEPLATGVWWVEYVARHRGAAHMHCAGLDLSWWEYHGVDVWATLLAAVLGVVGGGGWLLLLGWRWVIGGVKKTERAQQQKKRN